MTEILGRLEPEAGKTSVSSTQKTKAIVSAGLSEEQQTSALETVISEGEFIKFQAGYEQGISPALYLVAKDAIAAFEDGNGTVSQEEAKKALKGMDGLTKEQKAVLWQVQNKSWKAENNPFSSKVGKQVEKALDGAVSKSDTAVERLHLPEE